MKNIDREKREYDYCLKRFSKYGFDIRESLAEEWFSQKEEDQAHKDAEKYISEGGIFVPCVNCGNMFYVTSKEIQKVRDRKAKRPELCENCNEQDNLARVSHQESPYKNRIVDNLDRYQLKLIGTGQYRWEAGIKKARCYYYSYEIPNDSVYDCCNEDLVKWVTTKASEGLKQAKEKYNSTVGFRRKWACCDLAIYIWILEGPNSVGFINCVREYLDLPLINKDNLNSELEKENKTTIFKSQKCHSDSVQTRPVRPNSEISKTVTQSNRPQNLKEYFESKGLNVVDKRSSGGCFWVLGNEETIQKYTDEASRLFEVSGCFCDGGKATNYKRSWYTKDNK